MPKPRRPRKESVVVKSRGTLGESSGSDDTEADETTAGNRSPEKYSRNVSKFRADNITAGNSSPETRSRRPKASEAFRTPENEPDVTDYGLEFTTSHIQNPSPRRCSTLRTGSSQEESATRKEAETEHASRARRDRTGGEGSIDVTPTTSGPSNKTTKQNTKQPPKSKGKSQQQPNETSDRSESESTQPSEEQSASEEVAEKFRPTNTAPEKAIKQGPKSKGKTKAKNTLTESNSKSQPKETTEKTTAKAAKKKSRKQAVPQMRHFFREVKTLQNRTDFLLPRLPFSRVIREIIMGLSQDVTKITPTALEALQTASEMYMTQRLQDAYMLTLHRGRVTLDVRDMQLINFLKLDM